jgi:phosphoribosylformimino-5-aminoimidazole carboxamide ribotide isomerase
VQGDYERETVFDADPGAAARRWAEQGAKALHVVDLDGAREGAPVNLKHVRRIAADAGVPVQLGGGLRTAEAVETALEAGVARVVLGTAAVKDPALVEALVAEHGARVAVAVDSHAGRVAVDAWQRPSAVSSTELISELAGRGARRFIHTPVEVDGTLEGPGMEGLEAVDEAVRASGGEWVYSGGIGDVRDLRDLAEAGLQALAGVIVGRALYEGRFTVAEGQAALSGS